MSKTKTNRTAAAAPTKNAVTLFGAILSAPIVVRRFIALAILRAVSWQWKLAATSKTIDAAAFDGAVDPASMLDGVVSKPRLTADDWMPVLASAWMMAARAVYARDEETGKTGTDYQQNELILRQPVALINNENEAAFRVQNKLDKAREQIMLTTTALITDKTPAPKAEELRAKYAELLAKRTAAIESETRDYLKACAEAGNVAFSAALAKAKPATDADLFATVAEFLIDAGQQPDAIIRDAAQFAVDNSRKAQEASKFTNLDPLIAQMAR